MTTKFKVLKSFVSGMLLASLVALFSYAFFFSIPKLQAAVPVTLSGGGKIIAWFPCCEGIIFQTNPLIESSPAVRIPPKTLNVVVAAAKTEYSGAKNEYGLPLPLMFSNTAFVGVPFTGTCFTIASACIVPVPALFGISQIGFTLPTPLQ